MLRILVDLWMAQETLYFLGSDNPGTFDGAAVAANVNEYTP